MYGKTCTSEMEGAAVADTCAATLQNASRYGQTEPGTSVLGSEVGGEQPPYVLLGDTGSVVLNDYVVIIVGRHGVTQGNHYPAVGIAFKGLYRIVDEIHEHPRQLALLVHQQILIPLQMHPI